MITLPYFSVNYVNGVKSHNMPASRIWHRRERRFKLNGDLRSARFSPGQQRLRLLLGHGEGGEVPPRGGGERRGNLYV